jgi:hypothetical protein
LQWYLDLRRWTLQRQKLASRKCSSCSAQGQHTLHTLQDTSLHCSTISHTCTALHVAAARLVGCNTACLAARAERKAAYTGGSVQCTSAEKHSVPSSPRLSATQHAQQPIPPLTSQHSVVSTCASQAPNNQRLHKTTPRPTVITAGPVAWPERAHLSCISTPCPQWACVPTCLEPSMLAVPSHQPWGLLHEIRKLTRLSSSVTLSSWAPTTPATTQGTCPGRTPSECTCSYICRHVHNMQLEKPRTSLFASTLLANGGQKLGVGHGQL